MGTQDTDLAAICRRVENLEQQNRWLKRGLFLTFLCVGVASLAAANVSPTPQDVVAAKRFQLVDDDGKIRVQVFMAGDKTKYPAFSMYDEEGKERLALRLKGNGEVWCLDKDGKPRIGLRGFDKGGVISTWNAQNQLCFDAGFASTTVRRVFQLTDEKGKVRAMLSKFPKECAVFKLMDSQGASQIALSSAERAEEGGGNSIDFFDAGSPQLMLQLGLARGQTPVISGFDATNTQVFYLNSKQVGGRDFQRIQ
jgi:hypothetical protein